VSLEADRARNRRIELVMTGNDIQTAEALEAVKRLGIDDE
jgi:hypothetical protein